MIRSSLLIISLMLVFAGTLDAHSANSTPEGDGLERFAPLPELDASILFKAAINIRGSYFSGLILIKELPSDSAVHLVFLSELGLNLLEMAYKNETFQVLTVQEFLNKPAILKTLQGDFRTILLDLSRIEDFKTNFQDDAAVEELKFRHGGQRYKYSFSDKTGSIFIRKKKGVLGRVDYTIKKLDTLTIGISHRCFRLGIDLRELNKLENNGQ